MSVFAQANRENADFPLRDGWAARPFTHVQKNFFQGQYHDLFLSPLIGVGGRRFNLRRFDGRATNYRLGHQRQRLLVN